jgi:hypothetical protein
MTVVLLDLSGKSQRPGFDGDQPVSLALRAVDGRTALEALTAFAGKEVTWQIHNGVIEVGPRPHLARQDAREIRVYETTDLAIDPPDWEPGKTIQRRNSDEVIGELVKMIVTHCEPDAFLPAPATRIDEETINPFIDYLERLDTGWQATFMTTLAKSEKQKIGFRNARFAKWVSDNADLL